MARKQMRVQTAWEPTWDGPIKEWTLKFIWNQKWRCDQATNEVDDLLQDGHIVFMRISTRYPRVMQPNQFMALYKTAYANLIHDKSCHKRRRHHKRVTKDISELHGLVGETTNTGYIKALLEEAPDELKLAMALVTSGTVALRGDEPLKTLNAKLRRILGLESTFDLKQAIHELLFN
jgi:hypothetical protein